MLVAWFGPSVQGFGQDSDSASDSVHILVVSEPAGGSIFLQNQATDLVTPAQVKVLPGEVQVEVMLEDYEPLAKRVRLVGGQMATIRFVLKSYPPQPITAESLGLERHSLEPLLDEKIAKQVEDKWLNMSEIFAVVPLGQGIIARFVLPSDQHASANAMIMSGAILSLGTYLVGKTVGRRKMSDIRRRNEEIPAENEAATSHNLEIDQAVKAANDEAMRRWTSQNSARGTVSVTIE